MLSAASGASFTNRQRQVVSLIAGGHSNLEMAEILGVSPRTVKAHCDTLRTKLRVSRRRQIPAAFRSVTGLDPHSLESLEAATGATRDSSRVSR